jgi:hypothetical protein
MVGMTAHLLRGPFTVDAYQRLGQVVAMTPIGDRHAACVSRLTNLLAGRAAPRFPD